ncbi:MAG: thrombospondin type 3 repeat-containing protein, partial [Candidatus Zixiibacteriota bacterium]
HPPTSPCRDAGHPDVVFNDPDGSRSDVGATPSIDDRDFDGIRDSLDVCYFDPLNDVDSDGVCGEQDNCPAIANPDQTDSDSDGIGDVCDLCPFDPRNDQDSDGVCGDLDNCPFAFNPDQADSNSDGVGDACECSCPWHTDINADGLHDAVDLAFTIDCVFFGCPDVQDPMCPTNRHDFNADGFADATDLALLIDYVFFGQDGPCDPCNPVQPTCAP